MKNFIKLPPKSELIKAFDYDEYTGVIKWKTPKCTKVKPGDDAGVQSSNGYKIIGLNSKKYLAHRLIWKMYYGFTPYKMQIDHINGNRSDNRITNLRLVTNLLNGRNQKMNNRNTSGYRGVHWNKERKKWQVTIRINGKSIYCGLFQDINDAIEKYRKIALENNFTRRHIGVLK